MDRILSVSPRVVEIEYNDQSDFGLWSVGEYLNQKYGKHTYTLDVRRTPQPGLSVAIATFHEDYR